MLSILEIFHIAVSYFYPQSICLFGSCLTLILTHFSKPIKIMHFSHVLIIMEKPRYFQLRNFCNFRCRFREYECRFCLIWNQSYFQQFRSCLLFLDMQSKLISTVKKLSSVPWYATKVIFNSSEVVCCNGWIFNL